jgi:hypothetical protein
MPICTVPFLSMLSEREIERNFGSQSNHAIQNFNFTKKEHLLGTPLCLSSNDILCCPTVECSYGAMYMNLTLYVISPLIILQLLYSCLCQILVFNVLTAPLADIITPPTRTGRSCRFVIHEGLTTQVHNWTLTPPSCNTKVLCECMSSFSSCLLSIYNYSTDMCLCGLLAEANH